MLPALVDWHHPHHPSSGKLQPPPPHQDCKPMSEGFSCQDGCKNSIAVVSCGTLSWSHIELVGLKGGRGRQVAIGIDESKQIWHERVYSEVHGILSGWYHSNRQDNLAMSGKETGSLYCRWCLFRDSQLPVKKEHTETGCFSLSHHLYSAPPTHLWIVSEREKQHRQTHIS